MLSFALLCCREASESRARQQDPSTGETSLRPDPGDQEEEPVVHVPVGEFKAGSLPKEPGRDPALEPIVYEVKLGPFRIDRNVHPDGGSGPKLVGDPKEAEALCAKQGGRLCTELEWERACRGPASTTFPGSEEPCRGECRSGFDVLGMTAHEEWTASRFGEDSAAPGKPVVRGASVAMAPGERRCARRAAATSEAEPGRAFRCCYGAPNAAKVAEPAATKLFEEVDVTLAELKTLLEASEQTKELAPDVSFFKEDAAATVLARGPGDTMGFSLTTRAVRWSPARGVRLLVIAGRSGKKTAFVVAYHLGVDPPKLAGSFIMKNERGPVALAYAKSIRPRMHFSGCWGCPGETGKLLFRPKETVVLLQP